MSRRRLALLAVAAVFIVLFGGRWLAQRYTEQLWFDALGQGERYRWLLLRAVGWQVILFAVSLVWYGANTLGVYGSIGAVHLPRQLGNLEIDEAVPARTLRIIALGLAALLAAATTYTFSDLDQYVALARTAVPVGLTEPVLHHDAAFYLAVVPLLDTLHLLSGVAVLLATMLVVALYAATGSLTVSRRRVRITPHARTHLVALLSALALVAAWGFQLDAYQLVGGGGHALGALSATDRAVRIPAATILAGFALIVAVGSAASLRWMKPRLLFALWGLLGVSVLLGRLLIPVMAEAWGAGTNPLLAQSVAQLGDGFSRASFGLLELSRRPLPHVAAPSDSVPAIARAAAGLYAFSGEPGLPALLLGAEEGDTSRLRGWTASPMAAIGRDGRRIPAALAVPQTDMTLALRSNPRPRWATLHRDALAWGGEPVLLDATPRAGPLRFLAALAPADTVAPGTPVRRAPGRVRFLSRPADLGVIGPDQNTVDAPAPGVLLEGRLRRMLLAWALQTPPLLDDHTSNADRVVYWRDMPARLSRLYPFAAFDPPRAALVNERLTWVVDGYLMSSRFPLAESVRWYGETVNYLASPYLVTVDAATGLTRFYLRTSASAFAASVARAERVAPLPAESLPAPVREVLHYPSGLLAAQTAILARRGPGDQTGARWALAWPDTAGAGDAAAPATWTVMALPGEPTRMWQLLPLVDARGDHLTALLAGTTEQGRPRLLLLEVEGTSAPTPSAAAARIGATPALMAVASNVAGAGGTVPRGPVLVFPAGGTIAYAQLLLAGGDRPGERVRVEGVALMADGRVGFGATAGAAARGLVTGGAGTVASLLSTGDLTAARAAFLELDSARAAGDWERFGRAWDALRRAVHADRP